MHIQYGHGEVARSITAPATDEAKQWDGWGTALKPSVEFFTLCRKPLSESTVAKNVLKWGTGGINIDGCRVEGIAEVSKTRLFTKTAFTRASDTAKGLEQRR
jgi:hypothetical protein